MFTSAATTEISKYASQADFHIEWRSDFSGTSTYADAPWVSADYTHDEDQPATLTLPLVNASLAFSNELSSNTSPSFLGAYARVTARVGSETQILFFGQADEIPITNENFTVKYSDPMAALAEANCEQTLEPTQVVICDENTQLAITKISDRIGEVYGIPYAVGGPQQDAFADAAVAYAISSIDLGANSFKIAGDHTAELSVGMRFEVIDNSPATVNGWYTVTIFAYNGVTTEIQVSETIASSTVSGGKVFLNGLRRSWARTIIQVWLASGSLDDPTNEVSPSHYQVDYVNGAITILETAPPSQYYITGVTAYKESAAASATNVDFVRLFEQILAFPAQKNGSGHARSILAVNTGSKTFTIAGDYREWYADTTVFHITGSTSNDGRYTVSGTPTYSGGKTTITVVMAPTSSTADGWIVPLDAPDIGIDISKAWYFYGRVSDFMDELKKEQQANLKFYFYAPTMKFHVVLITQKAAHSEDWTLVKPVAIDQGRDSHDLFTSIELVGDASLPPNRLQEAWSNSLVTDLTGAGSQWSIFDGANVNDDTYTNSFPKAFDGDANYACLNHNLPATYSSGDPDGLPGSTGTTKYDSWYPMVKIDLGEVLQIQKVQFIMPGSRNQNASQRSRGPGVWFWPGVTIMVSEDDSTYHALAPQLYKHRDHPNQEIVAEGGDILRPKARYLKVYGGAYKEGFDNQSDPAVGIGELNIYTNTQYRVKRRIAPLFWIRAVNTGSKKFTITGDYADGLDVEFTVGDQLIVTGSTGNDGTYTIASATAVSGNTEVVVNETVSSSTADGYLYDNGYYLYTTGEKVARAYPSLWVRFGRRFKVSSDNIGSQYDEQIAGDRALSLLEESIRLFQKVQYDCPFDPRPLLYQTVKVNDDYNGDIQSILVRGVTHHIEAESATSSFTGSNFLAAVLT